MIAPNAVPKTHPASREATPDDPFSLHAVEVPGDPDLMLRLLIEEYARMGYGRDELMRLARDPNYQAFHGLLRLYGEAELHRRLGEILARVGVFRVRTREAEPAEQDVEQLLQIEPPPNRTANCPSDPNP
jgi:hypothetical protein